ncbi:MAG: MOSC domain-containing protein [Trebonia sp.]
MTEDGLLGTVAVLRRYPVKSMLGEDVRACDVTGRGLAGDRALALVHRETGKVASAKNPRLWRGLLRLAAASGPDVKVVFPDGTALASTDPGIHAALSEFLGQTVTLTDVPPPDATLDRADPEQVLRDGIEAPVRVEVGQLGGASPAGTFFDFAPLHLLTTSSLARIAELSPRGTVEPERYRPNLVIQTTVPGFTENDWVGRDLRIGSDLAIRVVARTPRCAIPTLEHGDQPRDVAALRVLAAHNRVSPQDGVGPQPCAGVYAQVLRQGRIHVGDAVRPA